MKRRIFITGSTDGLGMAAAQSLIGQGHSVLLHARSKARAASIASTVSRGLGVVIGDLASAAETRALAASVNRFGRMDAVIHNAGMVGRDGRGDTAEGHASTLAVNVLAPYILTALIERPARLIYIGSSMHRGADASLRDIDWTTRPWNADLAYSESKLYITALAFAVARRWPGVVSSAVDPGWVPTKMGGPSAPDKLPLGHATQEWLAVSDEPAARASGRYWHHLRQADVAPTAADTAFQDRLVARLAELTGVQLPAA
ncbi:MAG TPA: SDR family NAD(P)-dependent oxidoreductase [Luteitalea sp.]|nr:SDR family NAD(P)-dependent oxidoreductase [Luteitalea sp.]